MKSQEVKFIVTRHWNLMNSYWMFWICCLRGARSELTRWAVSSQTFLKIVFRPNFTTFLLFDTRKSCLFQIFLLRSIKAYLCPNIITFDSLDFSEHRAEEVHKFLLTLSVCMCVCVLAKGINREHPWVLLQATGHIFHTGHICPFVQSTLVKTMQNAPSADPRGTLGYIMHLPALHIQCLHVCEW